MTHSALPFRSRSGARPQGFTLIELLVVITILGVLMGLGFSGVSAIRQQAKNAQARSDCVALSGAILNFYGEYNRYPTARQEDAIYEPGQDATGGNAEVIKVLTAQDAVLNPRQVVYYDGKNAKRSKSTGKYEAGLSPEGAVFDPWGNTYGILMDANYDGKLTYSGGILKEMSEENRRVSGGAGVFSLGKDSSKGILSWAN